MTDHRPLCVLIVTGSIAAYKAPIVVRRLRDAGYDVDVVLTRSAARFVGPSTFAGLTGRPAFTEMFDPARGGELHVELAAAADVILVAPATADFLARLATGRADDLACATVLCSSAPVFVAPAMHPSMWDKPQVRRNVERLAADGVSFIGPADGAVASGDSGVGRMTEPEDIVRQVEERTRGGSDLAGRHVVVSAGPTVEDLDPVRFITNRSTGKMGFAVAARAASRGARVTLVAGPVQLPTPRGVTRVDVRGALEMQAALDAALGPDLSGADALVMTAAVADYRPKSRAQQKLKRVGEPPPIELVSNPDLIATIGARRKGKHPVLVAFAVETVDDEALVLAGRRKLMVKKVDLVVANHASESFGRDDNRAAFVTAADAEFVGPVPKLLLAERLIDRVVGLLSS